MNSLLCLSIIVSIDVMINGSTCPFLCISKVCKNMCVVKLVYLHGVRETQAPDTPQPRRVWGRLPPPGRYCPIYKSVGRNWNFLGSTPVSTRTNSSSALIAVISGSTAPAAEPPQGAVLPRLQRRRGGTGISWGRPPCRPGPIPVPPLIAAEMAVPPWGRKSPQTPDAAGGCGGLAPHRTMSTVSPGVESVARHFEMSALRRPHEFLSSASAMSLPVPSVSGIKMLGNETPSGSSSGYGDGSNGFRHGSDVSSSAAGK